jgi:hypothetical protein
MTWRMKAVKSDVVFLSSLPASTKVRLKLCGRGFPIRDSDVQHSSQQLTYAEKWQLVVTAAWLQPLDTHKDHSSF